jgi:hypothetical protein
MQKSKKLDQGVLDELRNSFRGDLVVEGDEEYQKSIEVLWNLMHHHIRPLLIVQPRNSRDVSTAIKWAARNGIPLTVKGGGHNSSGRSLLQDGLVIDLGRHMTGVRVDTEKRTALVQGGCTWRDVDFETAAFGLAVPGGVVSSTGVGGLTLGGGWGFLTKQYGLTADNLISIDVVLGDGTLITCSENSYQDLFWALRGGGGNFGVATAFLFKLHPVAPKVYGGLFFFPIEKIQEIIGTYRKILPGLPPKAVLFPLITLHPENPSKRVLGFVAFYEGSENEGAIHFKDILDYGPLINMLGETTYDEFQMMMDKITPRARYYWKSGFIKDITPEILELCLEGMEKYPSALGGILFENYFPESWGKGLHDNTAFPHKRNQFCLLLDCEWNDPKDDSSVISWCRETFAKLEKYFVGAYLNFSPDDDKERIFSRNMDKLVEIKKKYDPKNVFCHTNNNLPMEPRQISA